MNLAACNSRRQTVLVRIRARSGHSLMDTRRNPLPRRQNQKLMTKSRRQSQVSFNSHALEQPREDKPRASVLDDDKARRVDNPPIKPIATNP